MAFDAYIIPLLICVPIASAAFVVLVPTFDIPSVRQIVTALLWVWLGILLRGAFIFFIQGRLLQFQLGTDLWISDSSFLGFSIGADEFLMLLACWVVWFCVFFLHKVRIEEHGLGFHIVMLMQMALMTLAICIESISTALIAGHLALLLALFLVVQFGGTYRGSTTLKSAIFFLVVDLSALALILLTESRSFKTQESILCFLIVLPGLARLFLPLVSPYARTLIANCPSEILTICLGTFVPFGAIFLLRVLHSPTLNILSPEITFIFEMTMILCAFLGALWAFGARGLGSFCVALLSFHSSIFVANAMIFVHSDQVFKSAIVFSGILCSSFMLFSIRLIQDDTDPQKQNPNIRQLWFASLVLFLPFPFLGVGTAMWSYLVPIFSSDFSTTIVLMGWTISITIYLSALIQHTFVVNYLPPLRTPAHDLASNPAEYGVRAWIFYLAIFALSFLMLIPQLPRAP